MTPSSLARFQGHVPLLSGSRCQAVPHRHRSYAALRLPGLPWPRLRFPSPLAYLVASAYSTPASARTRGRGAVGDLDPAPRWPLSHEEMSGYPRLLCRPLSHVPWSNTSPAAPPPHALRSVATLLPSGDLKPWAEAGLDLSLAAFPRPTRSPTYASTPLLPPALQGWLPVCRAQL
jgi:hypothetical protein